MKTEKLIALARALDNLGFEIYKFEGMDSPLLLLNEKKEEPDSKKSARPGEAKD
jgi:hypothetical protein